MSYLVYKEFLGSVEYDPDDHLLYGKMVGVPDLVLYHGTTVEELEAAFKEAVDDFLDYCQEAGRDPRDAKGGTARLTIQADLHRRLTDRAAAAGKSLNELASEVLEAHLSS